MWFHLKNIVSLTFYSILYIQGNTISPRWDLEHRLWPGVFLWWQHTKLLHLCRQVLIHSVLCSYLRVWIPGQNKTTFTKKKRKKKTTFTRYLAHSCQLFQISQIKFFFFTLSPDFPISFVTSHFLKKRHPNRRRRKKGKQKSRTVQIFDPSFPDLMRLFSWCMHRASLCWQEKCQDVCVKQTLTIPAKQNSKKKIL